MSPKEILKRWVAAFNRADVDAISDCYVETAINHQVNQDPVIGKTAIRAMVQSEFAQAEMTCIIENIFEDGEWAILEWKDPLGLRGCGFFQIKDNLIHFQRGYWDELSFLRMHKLPLPLK